MRVMKKSSLLCAMVVGLSASSALAQETQTLLKCEFQYFNVGDQRVPPTRGPSITIPLPAQKERNGYIFNIAQVSCRAFDVPVSVSAEGAGTQQPQYDVEIPLVLVSEDAVLHE